MVPAGSRFSHSPPAATSRRMRATPARVLWPPPPSVLINSVSRRKFSECAPDAEATTTDWVLEPLVSTRVGPVVEDPILRCLRRHEVERLFRQEPGGHIVPPGRLLDRQGNE